MEILPHQQCLIKRYKLPTKKFGKVSKEDLINYTVKDKPFDKAGSYGIQDWFGLVAVESLNGSYSNIVGLPTYEVYNKLKEMMCNRSPLKSGIKITELNKIAQSILPGLVELLVNGYGDKDGGWESTLFSH